MNSAERSGVSPIPSFDARLGAIYSLGMAFWRHISIRYRWVATGVAGIGLFLTVSGIGGLPDDIATWADWLGWLRGDLGRWLFVAGGVFLIGGLVAERLEAFPKLGDPKPAEELGEHPMAVRDFDPIRHMFSKLMRVDVAGLWIEHTPYIDFIVHVRQTSEWTVTLDNVQGPTLIGGIETDRPPRLVNSPRRLNDPRRWWDCTIRQHLPQSLALELTSHPGNANLWGDDAKVTFSLAGLKWIGSVCTPRGDIALPERAVLDSGFTILGPVRESDGDKVLWATETLVVSQVHRQRGTGELREPAGGGPTA